MTNNADIWGLAQISPAQTSQRRHPTHVGYADTADIDADT